MGTNTMVDIRMNFKREITKVQKLVKRGDQQEIATFLLEKLREIIELREQNNMLKGVYREHEDEKSKILHKVMITNTENGKLKARIKELEAELGPDATAKIPDILRAH